MFYFVKVADELRDLSAMMLIMYHMCSKVSRIKGDGGGLVSPGRAKYGVEYPYLSPLFLGRTQLSTSLGVSERTPRPPISFTSLRVKLRILTKTFMKRGSVKKNMK